MSHAHYARLIPLVSLNQARVTRLMSRAHKREVDSRTKLNAHEERNWFVYLLDGQVKLKTAAGKMEKIVAGTERALRPLFNDPKMTETVVVQGKSSIIKVDKNQFELLSHEQDDPELKGIEVNDIGVFEVEADIVRRLFADYQNNRIPVPSMPEMALRIRQMSENPESSIDDLARLVEADPAIAGKLVVAANSALTGGAVRVTGPRDALVRLGMKAGGQLLMSLSLRELFKFSCPQLKKVTQDTWRHSVLVAAHARVLAARGGHQLDGERAFLAGLLHAIGAVALLSYFDQSGSEISPVAVTGSIRKLCNMVSGMVLQRWRMDAELVLVAEMAGSWEMSGKGNRLADLVNVAKHQAMLIQQPNAVLPLLEAIPSFAGFENEALGEDGVLSILRGNPSIEATLDILN